MSLDPGWLKFLDIKGSAAFALFVASVAVYLCAYNGWLYASELPGWALGLNGAMVLYSGAMLLVRIATSLLGWRARATGWLEAYRRRSDILRYLDDLKQDEREILAWLTTRGQRWFQSDSVYGARASPLVKKGLTVSVRRYSHDLDWTFEVPGFVWRELQRRRADFKHPHPNRPLQINWDKRV
jgi:hypothetical protein